MYGHAHAQHYSLERKLKTQDLKKFYVEMRPTDEQSPPFCLSVYLFLFFLVLLSGTLVSLEQGFLNIWSYSLFHL